MIVIVVKIIAFVVFLKGFFPVKHSMSGFANKPAQTEPTILGDTQSVTGEASVSLPHTYDRLVLVVIDALRADFVLPGGTSSLAQMEFVKNLIHKNETYSYMARAHPPTVTMPRIKVCS
jgi:ethanolaminephosphotransferase